MRAGAAAVAFGSVFGRLAVAEPVRAAASPITLVFQPWFNFPNATTTAGLQLLHQGLNPWLQRHPGVRVNIVTLGYQGTMEAALLAGTGPDVFADWVLPPYVESAMLLDIAPYVKEDNVDLSIYPSGEMQYFFEAAAFARPGALYTLPSYLHTAQMGVNLGLLDQLGLTYPEPGWTWQEWDKLWRTTAAKSAGPSKQPRYGGQFAWDGYDYSYDSPHPLYLKGFGGEYVDPTDPTKSYLGQPGSIECLNWIYDLQIAGVTGGGNVVTGNQVSWVQGTAGDLPYAAEAYNSIKWAIFHLPVFPKGKVSYAASDFYAISAATKYPDLAWSLLKYLCVEKDWQRHMMQIALAGPNQKPLWEEFVARVEAVAPTLRNKNLQVFAESVLNDEPYFGLTFKYADTQAKNIIDNYSNLVMARKMTWSEAGPLAAKQIAAVEQAGAVIQAQEFAALQAARRLDQVAGPVRLSPPPVKGQGVPPTLAPSYAVHVGGTWTLLGDGTDVWGSSDNCVYACAPMTSDIQTFVCRVVALSNVSCPNVSGWAKVGLMARADLSDNAPMVNLDVTGGNGIAFQSRPTIIAGPGNQNGSGGKSGLVSAQYLTANLSKPMANYLLKPIWLKLERHGTMWHAFTSWDGVTWTPAGSPTPVEMTSAWIGVFACAHNGDFNGKGYIRATFDNLQGFTPLYVYQIGQSGVPPAAGPVPKNWATLVVK